MKLDNESIRLITWLKFLPKNTTIEWTSDDYSVEHPYCNRWVDIRVPQAEEELGINWFWTIVNPENDDLTPEEAWQFVVKFNLDIHCIYDPTPPNYWFINEIIVKKGEELTEEEEAELETTLGDGAGRVRTIEGGWSPEAINEGLELWALLYAERPDIKFEWNPALGVSRFAIEAEERLNRILNGEEVVTDLGDGLKTTDGVMDFLLGLGIDEAAKMTKKIKDMFKNQ